MRPRRWSHVSRHILVGVALELALVTAAMYWWAGLSVWAGVAIAASVIVGFRCLISLFTFTVSWFFSARDADTEPLYLHQLLGIMARETGAVAIVVHSSLPSARLCSVTERTGVADSAVIRRVSASPGSTRERIVGRNRRDFPL